MEYSWIGLWACKCQEVTKYCELNHQDSNGYYRNLEKCRECGGENLNEEKTKCWDCSASDYQDQ